MPFSFSLTYCLYNNSSFLRSLEEYALRAREPETMHWRAIPAATSTRVIQRVIVTFFCFFSGLYAFLCAVFKAVYSWWNLETTSLFTSIGKNTLWIFLHIHNTGGRSHDFRWIQYHYFTHARSKVWETLSNGILLSLWYKSTTILSLKSVYHRANYPSPKYPGMYKLKHTQIQGSESKLRCLEVKPNEILFH